MQSPDSGDLWRFFWPALLVEPPSTTLELARALPACGAPIHFMG